MSTWMVLLNRPQIHAHFRLSRLLPHTKLSSAGAELHALYQFFFNLFIFIYVLMWGRMNVRAVKGQKRTSDPIELEL